MSPKDVPEITPETPEPEPVTPRQPKPQPAPQPAPDPKPQLAAEPQDTERLDIHKKVKGRSWWQPSNFREAGAAIVSLLMLIILAYAICRTYKAALLGASLYYMEGEMRILDRFGQAKDLLTILFPLFTAITSFWMGVAVEGRHADDATEQAQAAREERLKAEAAKAEIAEAKESVEATLAKVKQEIDRIEGIVEAAAAQPRRADGETTSIPLNLLEAHLAKAREALAGD